MSFIESLEKISKISKEKKTLTIQEIFHILVGRGTPALLILLSLPFCIPIQIPGFSTPFGLVLAFLGLRITFGKHLLWPKWILDKTIRTDHLQGVINRSIDVVLACQRLLRPRLVFLIQNPILHRIHGITVLICALLLSLPLPIPFSNLFSALPLFFFGLALLEDDGIFLIIAYGLAFLCFIYFSLITLGVEKLFSH